MPLIDHMTEALNKNQRHSAVASSTMLANKRRRRLPIVIRLVVSATHAALDAVEQDLQRGKGFSERLRRNLSDDRSDRFRVRVERHLDGAAADAQLVSVGRHGRSI